VTFLEDRIAPFKPGLISTGGDAKGNRRMTTKELGTTGVMIPESMREVISRS
jgi:hypothetical protein